MIDFTGERVIPGQVNPDLWSEHFARYAFARRYAPGMRVLDAGCGAGYGSAELAESAGLVVGLDIAPEAALFARETYRLPNLRFVAGSCTSMPFRDGCFDLITAFEVIEHLPDYRGFLSQAARVLLPDGLLVVSTPNRRYYAESRAGAGPNPYHEHEFEAAEFCEQLRAFFPNVCLLLQNWVGSFAFHPAKAFWPAEARIDGGGGSADDAHFLIAVCSRGPLPEPRSFAYVPKAANILREREQHIEILKQQVAQARPERDYLLGLFRKQTQELEEHNRWADQLNQQLTAAHSRIGQLQDELTREQTAAVQVAHGYEQQVQNLERENEAKTVWAQDTERRLLDELSHKSAELAECVRLLEQAEATVEERTLWAQRTESKRQELEAVLNGVRASRWLRLGQRVGLGPAVQEP